MTAPLWDFPSSSVDGTHPWVPQGCYEPMSLWMHPPEHGVPHVGTLPSDPVPQGAKAQKGWWLSEAEWGPELASDFLTL